MTTRRTLLSFAAAAPAAAVLAAAAPAAAHGGRYVEELALPNGFAPEGIAIGREPYAYVGSLADGSVYRADLRTGEGRILVAATGAPAVGLHLSGHRLYVAGGPGGGARVVDARTGGLLAAYHFTDEESFVNDAVVTDRAAYFTDSFRPAMYVLPFGRGGRLPGQDEVYEVPLTGDLVHRPGGWNANGIERTPDGRSLLVVQMDTGGLYRVDARGRTSAVDVGGADLTGGDGLRRDGRTLYVAQSANRVSVLRLNRSGSRAELRRVITDARFDSPTTTALHKGRLYVVNARFDQEPGPGVAYRVVSVPS